ncbi:ankyrin repeat-containing domain protein [Gorgonomyces haynaldii]|nr:ankyrin repeat-containing domain protein [Gorgonomyces haynaldii]
MHGHNELIELLLDNGFGVNEENGYDVKPLGCAIVEHHPDTCRLLIERGADLDYAGFSSSAMHVAAEYSTPEILQMLVNAGQDVNLVEGDETPIHKVACYGTVENAQWLVEHGADLWMRGDSDLSVLDYSLYNSDSAVFEYLLQRYLESDPSEYWKEDALTNAAHACNFKACQKLLDLGANVNGNPQSSKTPLYNSVHGGHHGTRLQSIYDILMEHGADLYVGDASKECVLKNAAASNQTDIMEALIKRDPRIVEWSCREGYYGALHTAVQSGRIEASQLLLKHGANINVTDEEGRTPLMIATHNAGLESLRTCLKLGQIYRSETIMDGV